MKSLMIVTLVFCFLCPAILSAQGLTERQIRIYNDYVYRLTKLEEATFLRDEPLSKCELKVMSYMVKKDYSLTKKELKDIIKEATHYKLTQGDWDIIHDTDILLGALSKDASDREKIEVYKKIAQRYTIGVDRVCFLHNIAQLQM